jgi:hypothetical protein
MAGFALSTEVGRYRFSFRLACQSYHETLWERLAARVIIGQRLREITEQAVRWAV